MNGSILLKSYGGGNYQIYGGPIRLKPQGMIGVNMTQSDMNCQINIPTKDFQVPPVELTLIGLRQALRYAWQGFPVYVGCGAGWGRTGTFLALLAKAWGIKDPVGWVRKTYTKEAVETADQERYVRDFVIPWDIRWLVFRMKITGIFS